jgi:hypothetical protein
LQGLDVVLWVAAKGDDFHESDLVEEAVGVFDRGNWKENGSGSTPVRAKPMPVGSVRLIL